MPDMQTFKIRAREFVIGALTEANGYAPAPNVIESTVNRLVNTFKPLLKNRNFIESADESKLSSTREGRNFLT